MRRFTRVAKSTAVLLLVIGAALSIAAPARAQDILQAPNAAACFEQWTGHVRNVLNAYSGDTEFNSRQPWSINQFGLFVAKSIKSNYEPDNWVQNGANRNQWMWNTYTSELRLPDWGNANFNGAGLQGLRWFVRNCVGDPGAGSTPPIVTGGGQSVGTNPALTLDTSAICPGNFSMHRNSTLILICYCDPRSFDGSVWGTGVYTHDSALCTAGLHAGAVGSGGGMLLVKGVPGQSAYQGTQSNGIPSSNFGSYDWSFLFPGNKPANSNSTSSTALACPANMTDLRGTSNSRTCQCDSRSMAGSVWGTNAYTDDSSICAAARHAGIIGPAGGTVTAIAAPGFDAYEGTERNGISSSSYGEWSGSFYFPQ